MGKLNTYPITEKSKITCSIFRRWLRFKGLYEKFIHDFHPEWKFDNLSSNTSFEDFVAYRVATDNCWSEDKILATLIDKTLCWVDCSYSDWSYMNREWEIFYKRRIDKILSKLLTTTSVR